jgi:ribosomal protein L31
VHLKRDGTRAETIFRLSPKRSSPFKSAGASVQSTAGSRGVRISVYNAGHTTFRGSVRVLATHSICQFPIHFPSRAHCVPSGFKRNLHTLSCTFSS